MSSFGKATIRHCVCEANGCAHELARFSFEGHEYGAWNDKASDFLIPFIVRASPIDDVYLEI